MHAAGCVKPVSHCVTFGRWQAGPPGLSAVSIRLNPMRKTPCSHLTLTCTLDAVADLLAATPATPPSPSPQQPGAASSSLSAGAIAGIAVGVVAGLVAIAGAYRLWVVRRAKRGAPDAGSPSAIPAPTAAPQDAGDFDDLEQKQRRRPPTLPPLRDAQKHVAAEAAAGGQGH